MKRMTFLMFYKGSIAGKYELVLNPEEYTLVEPARVNVTQTSGGAFIDDFGLGVPILYFRGHTGLKNGTNDFYSGFKHFKKLRDDVYRAYFLNQTPGEQNDHELHLYNFTDQDYLVVVPQIFTLQRSISQPLLFRYEARFMVMRYIDSREVVPDWALDSFKLPTYDSLLQQFLDTYDSSQNITPINA